jgi:hypothetical protein
MSSDTPNVHLAFETTTLETSLETILETSLETTSGTTSEKSLGTTSETTSETRSETTSETRSETTSETRSETTSETRSETTSETRSETTSETTNSVYIVKPVGHGACAGVGVTVVTNDRELEDARKELTKRFKNVIISEYIQNPLLYEGKKFHLRMYILINSEPFSWSFWDQGKAMTAKLKYKKGDWTNKLIHDSHGETTPKDIYFPEDILPKDKYDYVYKQMKTILGAVSEIIKPYVRCYEESKYCCEVFGIDFMITDDYTVKLIEINAEAGYGSKNEDKTKYKKYCSEYFDWFYKESLLFKLFYKSSKKLSRNIS